MVETLMRSEKYIVSGAYFECEFGEADWWLSLPFYEHDGFFLKFVHIIGIGHTPDTHLLAAYSRSIYPTKRVCQTQNLGS
jgi:hypothetical protein